MPKLSALEELQMALDLAAREMPHLPSREVAAKFYEDERHLFEANEKTWVIEKLAHLIASRRLKIRLSEDPQMLLGFKPASALVLPHGEKVAMDEATLHTMQQSRRLLWKKHRDHKHPAVAKLDKQIALMQEYASKKNPGITWAEVVKREAEKPREREKRGSAGGK